MEKTAILGGSFDPIHIGHLYLLHAAVTHTDYSRFIVVPAKVSNFKLDARPVSSDDDRMNMVRLAIEDYHELYPRDKKEIVASDSELKRGGISYTIDTVLEIKKQYNITDRIGLIMGDDHISALSKWYHFDQLKEEVEFIICPRNHKEDLHNIPSGIVYQIMNVDSVKEENATAVRENVKEYEHYLSKRVLSYVRENNLYN